MPYKDPLVKKEKDRLRYLKDREHLKQMSRINYYSNRDKRIAQRKSNYLKNIEHNKKYRRDYYKSNKESMLEYAKIYRTENKDDINKKIAEYRKTERGRHNCYTKNIRRRAREQDSRILGHHTLDEWKNILLQFNNLCAICGSDKKITKDHIIPISKGGSDLIENIQPLCLSCNCSKGNKIENEEIRIQKKEEESCK